VPGSRRISDDETSRYRFTPSDAFWAFFLIAWTALGIVAMLHDVAEYRWQQKVIAEFHDRMPTMVGKAPYDPAVGKRLIGEAAGGMITIAIAVFGVRRRRRGPIEVRVKWIPAPRVRSVPVKAVRVAAERPPPLPRRAPSPRAIKSGSLAADRLSAILRNDHVARLEKEHA
jgi:hypothetical protein